MAKKLIVFVALVALVAMAGFWWLVLRDDPPAELSVDGSSETASTTTGTALESLDGTWVVVEGADTTAGFRINESFGNGLVDHTAVGRSDAVSGSIDVSGTEITSATFTVDLTALSFSDDPGRSVTGRENALKSRGLETTKFPEATFTLTEPIDFGAMPEPDTVVIAEATGDLTIHGVTKPVTFTVEAKLVGDTIRVATQDPVPVLLADFDITKPTGGPIAEIDDQGSFEFLVVFGQG